MATHRFGGSWTDQKLDALRNYLVAYQKIFTANPNARNLRTVYVDAFAGTGERDGSEDHQQPSLFGYDEDSRHFQDGSAKIALALDSKFQQYVFIEKKRRHAAALRQLIKTEFADIADRCVVEDTEANSWLRHWCRTENWSKQRAVVFLDPYGMEVEWATIDAIAKTKAIDLWILFPLGIGPSRVLPNKEMPGAKWAERLTKLFGSEEWKSQFYHTDVNVDLFGAPEGSVTKIAGVDEILAYFLSRLKAVFEKIVEKPLVLENSKKSPMYALCFAAGNPRGAPTAVKIASYLTRA